MNYADYTADDFLLDDRFMAYCRGSDAAAVRFWTDWQRNNPANLTAFREAEQIARLLSAGKPRVDTALAELDALIVGTQQTPVPVVPMPQPRRRLWGWAAASVVLLAGVSWLGYQYWAGRPVTYATAYNEQRRIDLPDGSVVHLNSHSTLTYQRSDFSAVARTVKLAGEGYFSVQHTATDAPFRVLTDAPFDVRVLGTEFTVQARPERQRVVLNTGRVEVDFHDQRPNVVLRPGELVEILADKRTVRRQTAQPDQYNAWMRQQLVFNEATLTEVAEAIEAQYGTRVRIATDSLRQRRFTGILPLDKPETVLNALAQLGKLRVQQNGTEYVISHQP